ncbi:DUF1266 domain-containing protein [Variovorax sp. PBL-E5]|uniref:DUF1266 domain-containing protein n=1 Tax=Variovorax sp. PBL-E5 TaxID=434014 RepID=UPI00131970D8|nr:DUF1266 domain-containing protein [Variovorax sp. PBL-E5]VTU39623.1 hypothetical protein E5CHR_05149 [Variovorax sp. PBL-E5]
MEFLWTMLVGALLLLAYFGWRHFEWTTLRRSVPPPWMPAEQASADQLFGCLLSANLAVLADDDFKQLSSALSASRSRRMLAQQWKLNIAIECRRKIESWLGSPGAAEAEEREAWAAWREGRQVDSDAYRALSNGVAFLADAGIVSAESVDARHLSMVAWDVQQAAYVVRLGRAAGYLSRSMAESALARLQHAARSHYMSWTDYSLSAILGMGVRGRFDLVEWHRVAQSHELLLTTHAELLRRASFRRRLPEAGAMAPDARRTARPE